MARKSSAALADSGRRRMHLVGEVIELGLRRVVAQLSYFVLNSREMGGEGFLSGRLIGGQGINRVLDALNFCHNLASYR